MTDDDVDMDTVLENLEAGKDVDPEEAKEQRDIKAHNKMLQQVLGDENEGDEQ